MCRWKMQFYVSLEDDLMRIFGGDRVKNLMEKLGLPEDMPIENKMVSRSIEQAQKKVEGNNFDIRKHLVEYDDVLNKQREAIYARRRAILKAAVVNPAELKTQVQAIIEEEIAQMVAFHTALEDESKWNLEEIYEAIHSMFPVPKDVRKKLDDIETQAGDASADAVARDKIINYLISLAHKFYDEVEKAITAQARQLAIPTADSIMREAEKSLSLRAIDSLWVKHLTTMDYLRGSIGLQSYGQRDPLVEYKRQAFRMYKDLLASIRREVAYNIFKVGVSQQAVQAAPPRRQMQEQGPAKTQAEAKSVFSSAVSSTGGPVMAKPRDETGHKVGRNDPCPCGSGKKYKKCHGA